MIHDLDNLKNIINEEKLDICVNIVHDLDNLDNLKNTINEEKLDICMVEDIDNLDYLKNTIKEEKLDICVVSYGGSCSNTLVDTLIKNGYTPITNIWQNILCHCPRYVDIDIPIIYIYKNPINSFLSMKNRGRYFCDVNQIKLSNNWNTELSDENLLKLMIKQFNNWKNIKRDNVLIIKSSELFEENIIQKLETFLNKKINYFPIQYIEPTTKVDNITDISLIELFKKYKDEIEKINNFNTIN